MGILTNLVNTLAGELIGFGFDQLDGYVTREIQEGREENAFKALNDYEDFIAGQVTLGNQRAGVLPIGGTDYQMQIPQSMGLSQAPTGPMDYTASPDLMKNINKSNLASQMAYQKYNQALQNDPYFVQQEAQRKQQESMQELNKQLGFETFKQNQGGTQTARDIFAGGDITQDVRNQANVLRNRMLTTATETAKEPFREAALQRQIRGKQTPTYAQLRGGGGEGGGTINTINPATVNTIEKRITGRYPQYRTETIDQSTGKTMNVLNERGMRVSEIIAEKLATTKKPNAQKIESGAVAQEMREFKQQGQQDTRTFQSFANQQVKPTQAPKQTPLPTALPNLPKATPTTEPKAQPAVTAQQMINAISAAKAAGESSAYIRNMIKAKGFDPENFGY